MNKETEAMKKHSLETTGEFTAMDKELKSQPTIHVTVDINGEKRELDLDTLCLLGVVKDSMTSKKAEGAVMSVGNFGRDYAATIVKDWESIKKSIPVLEVAEMSNYLTGGTGGLGGMMGLLGMLGKDKPNPFN